MRGANSFQKLMEGPPRRGMPAYASDHGAICGIGADTTMSKGAAVPNPFPCGVRGHRCAGCLGLACLRAEDPCFFGQGPWPDGAAPRDHPTWAPASASSTGGASAGAKGGASASANQEWNEQFKALGHWLEEDLSAKEIDELNLIKDMGTSEEPGILRAHPDRFGRRGGAVVAGAARQRRGGISLMMCAPCPLTASSVRCCRPCTAHSYHPSAAYCSHLVDTPSGATVHEWD